ncbi:MAG: MBOAT family protein [Dysgonamonadaceae bacterium]|jgi:D-alanyl-lipoteichoic acid acyltransferase DltB (MBOAT superfamily)|nr:MBOAT family protein [Dysgonamonadaceae bacterium]
MLFNSIEFIIFLPVVFLLYWFVFKKTSWQNICIVVASYVFYGWWDRRFLLLIALTTLCSYLSGIGIERHEGNRRLQKAISALNIILNLSILCCFKYFNFFSENLALLFKTFGYELDGFTLTILLPVGISFYTFQALSYTIDVYRRKLKATHDPAAFFAFIGFFPQLVAGPIERATNLLPQFSRPRTFNYGKAVDGMRQMLWGFFKKVVVADNCAIFANGIFENYDAMSGSALFMGAFFFTIQIYGDFSGYSDIAMGCARLFGVDLMRNFSCPYFSRDIAEFWRRWHISLTTWFRDYVYIPLGGSRKGRWKSLRNTMVIFLVSGFWHGANLTFIVWGIYHALLFIPLLLSGRNRKYRDTAAAGRLFPHFKELLQMTLVFGLTLVGWIVFRAESIGQATGYLKGMCSRSLFTVPVMPGIGITRTLAATTFFFIFVLFIAEWHHREKAHGLDINLRRQPLRYAVYLAVLLAIFLFKATEPAAFVYFQF